MQNLTDSDFLKLAYNFGANSNDKSTQNGAVLVPEGNSKTICYGWNDLPTNVTKASERYTRPAKYFQ